MIDLGESSLAILACGALGLACQMGWPLMRTRRAMLTVQLGIGLGFGAQYALIGAWSGAGVCFLGATQTAIVLASGRDRPPRALAAVFIPAVFAVSLATWSGLPSLFALSAATLVICARLQPTTLRLRGVQLTSIPFAACYDLSVGALPALVGAGASAVMALVGLAMELRSARSAAADRRAGPSRRWRALSWRRRGSSAALPSS